MIFLYNLFVRAYVQAIRLAASWDKKAAEWTAGRKRLFEELEQNRVATDRLIWVHCSSAGELEQGKPVIGELKKNYPGHKVLVTFFSPSGYEQGKKYAAADIVTYLPVDTPSNARRFLDLVRPELVVFVKYEFWFHHLSAVAFRHIPLLLVSAHFRPGQIFFKPYGRFYRNMLFLFRHIFVQDPESLQLLTGHQVDHVSLSGDTRFDRVQEIATHFSPLPLIETFRNDEPLIVAGSTWTGDEELLAAFIKEHPVRLVLAPHEIREAHLTRLEGVFPGAVRFSRWKSDPQPAQVLLIDNVGMLSRLYYYATLCYVGGGFTRDGIHNILEAAVYGKPVVFGPNYQKYREATELIDAGGAFPVTDAAALSSIWKKQADPVWPDQAGKAARVYVEKNTGATETILRYIQANRLLTR